MRTLAKFCGIIYNVIREFLRGFWLKFMNCIFIYNPVSGKGRIRKRIKYVVDKLREKYEIVDVYETRACGDMTAAAREAAKKYDAIVFSGGDGSFNEVLQGVASAEIMPELGYIPSGTVNDIAHSLHIPKNIRRALKVILGGENVMLDCVKVNERYAMYVVAAGAFTSATYTTPQSQKKLIGRMAYGLEGIKKNMRFDVFPVEVRNGNETVNTQSVFVLLMNGRYVAGMHINKKGSFADGKLEIALVKQTKNPTFLKRIRAYIALARLFLFGYKFKEKQIVRFEGSEFEIFVPENVIWNFDGEKGISGNVKIQVLPKKINMIVPKGLKNI